MNLGAFLLCASAWRAVTVLAQGEAEARCGFRSREAEASRPDGQAHAPDSSASACGSPTTGRRGPGHPPALRRVHQPRGLRLNEPRLHC